MTNAFDTCLSRPAVAARSHRYDQPACKLIEGKHASDVIGAGAPLRPGARPHWKVILHHAGAALLALGLVASPKGAQAQCADVSISTTPAASACKLAVADVRWVLSSSNIRHSITGNSLTKTSGGGSWNGNAFSRQSVGANGYMETTVVGTNTLRMVGLSATDANADWTSIQYGFHLTSGGGLEIRESASGNLVGGLTYANGDVLRIAVENGIVKYYRNGTPVYISTTAPTLPLFVDVSTHTAGAVVSNVKVANGTLGVFTATAVGAGTAPTYQWKVNGANVGTNSANYTNTGLNQNDVLTCEVTASANGCAPGSVFASNPVLIQDIDQTLRNTFRIEPVPAASACRMAVTDVVWRQPASTARNTVNGNNLTKVSGGNSWNANGFSWNSVANNGYMETTVSGTGTQRMIGLSATDANADWNSIQHAFYLTSWGALEIRENGSGNLLGGLTYANGDVLRIAVENNIVKYYRNGTPVFISGSAPTLPLFVDVSLHNEGANVSQVKVANGMLDAFTATATGAGGNPGYQWKLNGVSVGANSPTYANANLNNGDVLICELTPDLALCTGSAFQSDTIVVQAIDQTQRNEFRIAPVTAASTCLQAVADVVWRLPTSAARNTVSGNNLTKVSGGNSWNANGFSWQGVANNGYMETSVAGTGTQRMIGLSATDANSDWNTIQYAFYLTSWGALEIRENGSGNLQGGLTYATGDVLRIAVENNIVKYYQNGTPVFISGSAPTLPLFVDVSLHNEGANVGQVKVANGVLGTFTATATNAGPSPIYQWELNGTSVGTNSPTYTNTNLNNGDVLVCRLTPDLAGCGTSAFTSNTIVMQAIDQALRSDYRIESMAVESACRMAVMDVLWRVPTSAERNTVNGNNLTKVSGGNSWNANGFSWQDVGNNGYMETTVVGTGTQRMIGLSSADANADWNTIQYAFYLTSWGALEIRENGSGNLQGGLTYDTGDVLRIAVENNIVKYYRNGSPVFSSGTAPTLPLYVDVSLHNVGANVGQVKVANGVLDTFTATAPNAGAAPTYQWRLNGANVGTNSPTYTNGGLNNGDVLVCRLTPDLAGCVNTVITSDTIMVRAADQTQLNEFRIAPTAAASSCLTAVVDVVWRLPTSSARNTVSGNSLTKLSGGNSWNANGFSWQSVDNNGYMETTVAGTGTNRMIGLSATDANADWTTIQHAFYLTSWGALEIRENGSGNLQGGLTYATGDVLRIAVENNIVKYYRNGTPVFSSSTTPALPLFVDVSLNEVGSAVSQVKVANGMLDTFTAIATNAGATPTYQWRLNGLNVGTNSATYTNANLAPGDVLVCRLTPSLPGCAASSFTSNTIVVQAADQTQLNEFRIAPTAAASSCLTAVVDVVWRLPTSAAFNTVSGNSLTKLSGGNSWNANGFSWQSVDNNGYMETTVAGTGTNRMIGLSATDANADWNTIQYAFYLTSWGALEIRENGSGNLQGGLTYATGDVLRIAVENNIVKYYRNGTPVFSSSTAPALPLFVDVSLNEVGSAVGQVKVANGMLDTFTAIATNAGSTPTYQWRLNGLNVGTNSATYTNASLAPGDVLVCRLTPSLAGCGSSVFTSDTIAVRANDQTLNNEFRISSSIEPDVCLEAVTNVVWRLPTSSARNTVSGNTLTKLSGGNSWNANGFSWQAVGGNGYMEFTAGATGTDRMIGLSAADANADWTSIQYGFMLTSWGALEIRENGSGNLQGGLTYANSDVLRIAVENSIVRYYRNGALLYTSNQVPGATLFVDVSINTVGGTVNNVRVANGTVGSFTAVPSNAGPSPSFQWRLNDVNVGTNSPSYTNGSLVNGDVVTCILTPDLPGCASSALASNAITISSPAVVNTNWIGTTNAWNNPANWSNGVPNKRRNAVITAGVTNPVISTNAQVNGITIGAGRTLTINASNTLEVFGNWTNQGTFTANTSTVRFQGCGAGNTISATGTQNFHRAVINNRFDVTVTAGTHNITNNLSFQRGDVINQATLRVQNSATATGASDQSHVVGFIQKAGTQAFTFPVGNGTVYRPIAIGAPTSSSTFSARYNGSDPDPLYPRAQKVLTLNNLSQCEYWDLLRPAGSANVVVTLSWNNAAVPNCQVLLPSDLLVAGWHSGVPEWQNRGNGGTTGTAAAGSVTSSAPVSVFGPFTLASAGGLNPLPVELLTFEAQAAEPVVDLQWSTATERDNAGFHVERSRDGLTFERIGFVQGAGSSMITLTYTFTDQQPYQGLSYYRLWQQDIDGQGEYGPVRVVNLRSTLELRAYPNPTADVVFLTNLPEEPVRIEVLDLRGRTVLMQEGGGPVAQLNLISLPPATYIVRVAMERDTWQGTIIRQ